MAASRLFWISKGFFFIYVIWCSDSIIINLQHEELYYFRKPINDETYRVSPSSLDRKHNNSQLPWQLHIQRGTLVFLRSQRQPEGAVQRLPDFFPRQRVPEWVTTFPHLNVHQNICLCLFFTQTNQRTGSLDAYYYCQSSLKCDFVIFHSEHLKGFII